MGEPTPSSPVAAMRGSTDVRGSIVGAGIGSLLFLVPVALFWGFAVDDAWIVARVAMRGVVDGQYSFHAWPSDAITPLGFERLVGLGVRLFGEASVPGALHVARLISLGGMLGSAALVGASLRHATGVGRLLGYAWLTLLTSAGAYASAGLETGLVTLLATFGARGSWRSDPSTAVEFGALGLAGGLRPELAPWCLFVAIAELRKVRLSSAKRAPLARLATSFLAAVALVPSVRFGLYGTWVPLSFTAKLPDLSHGLRYAFGGLAFAGLGPVLLATSRRSARTFLAGAVVHLAAVGFAGGDWMPLHRLIVPVLFWLVGGVFTASEVPRLRAVVGTAFGAAAAFLVVSVYAADSRAVVSRREAWIREGEPLLRGVRRVAAVDIGWLGGAFPGEIVDLAGVTDPRVAALPGGHTSKQVSPGFLAARDVDGWVLRDGARRFVPGGDLHEIEPVYAVDARLLPAAEDLEFRAIGVLPIPGTGGQYVFLRAP